MYLFCKKAPLFLYLKKKGDILHLMFKIKLIPLLYSAIRNIYAKRQEEPR